MSRLQSARLQSRFFHMADSNVKCRHGQPDPCRKFQSGAELVIGDRFSHCHRALNAAHSAVCSACVTTEGAGRCWPRRQKIEHGNPVAFIGMVDRIFRFWRPPEQVVGQPVTCCDEPLCRGAMETAVAVANRESVAKLAKRSEHGGGGWPTQASFGPNASGCCHPGCVFGGLPCVANGT